MAASKAIGGISEAAKWQQRKSRRRRSVAAVSTIKIEIIGVRHQKDGESKWRKAASNGGEKWRIVWRKSKAASAAKSGSKRRKQHESERRKLKPA